jgi:hypothetical protein
MWFFNLEKNLSGFLFWKNYYVVFLIGMNDVTITHIYAVLYIGNQNLNQFFYIRIP